MADHILPTALEYFVLRAEVLSTAGQYSSTPYSVALIVGSSELVSMPESPAPDLQGRLAAALAGQYRIDSLLGQGGHGQRVPCAYESLDRPVAINVIAPEVVGSADVLERFILESRTVARLRHPNIVAVYAAGETTGLLWFAIKFVPGASLRNWLTREGRLDETTALAVLHDMGMAMDHAHQQGLVHRDVKPENVLLDRESGRAMLTDFGVARGLELPPRVLASGGHVQQGRDSALVAGAQGRYHSARPAGGV